MKKLSVNGTKILEARYLLRNQKNEIVETPEQLFRRVAHAIALAELKYGGQETANYWEKVFFEMMANMEFLPNSPTLMNADLSKGQLSACFVLPIEDSLESIFSTLKDASIIQQSGGGTGFNFSSLRSKTEIVKSSGAKASGPVSFIKLFDVTTEQVKQAGKRRGANMAILNIDHPDIEEFIAVKSDQQSLQNFNLSVGISDAFINAVKAKSYWALKSPQTREVMKEVKASDLWDLIIDNAWKTGDPGLIFLDRIEATNPTPSLGMINSTNPCGEMPLLAYESCNLGSVNLSLMIKNDSVDWEKLGKTVNHAVRFLDDVIDVNHYPLLQIESQTKSNRKIGLGVMGWAEMLIRLGIPYASEEAVDLASAIMKFIKNTSRKVSTSLALEKGVFPNWPDSLLYPDEKLRNATTTSVAPTGTISIIADTSSSIEPLFKLAYERDSTIGGKPLVEINKLLTSELKNARLMTDEVFKQLVSQGVLGHIKNIPIDLKERFQTAHEISAEYHLRHQEAFQKHTDNAVSKTINIPHNATEESVREIFDYSLSSHLKGITIYRDGSKKRQILYAIGDYEQDKYSPHIDNTCRVCEL